MIYDPIPEKIRPKLKKFFLGKYYIYISFLNNEYVYKISSVEFDMSDIYSLFFVFEDVNQLPPDGEIIYKGNRQLLPTMNEMVEEYFGIDTRSWQGIRIGAAIKQKKDFISEVVNSEVRVEEVSNEQLFKDAYKLNKLYNQSVMNDMVFMYMLNYIINTYNIQAYYAYSEDEVVGFLIKGTTSISRERYLMSRISKKTVDLPDSEDNNRDKDVVLMIAVDEKMRGKGIFNRLVSLLKKPYLVHINGVFSPMEVWNKQGCKILMSTNVYGHENSVGICGSSEPINENDFPLGLRN
jgi:hypothetical protein